MNAAAFLLMSWLGFLPVLNHLDDTGLSRPEPVTRTGEVVFLTDVIKERGLSFDADPVAKQVVLVGDDSTVTPLLSSDASRALFLDERLRTRRAEIKGNQYPGLPYLQVVSFRVEDHGKLRTPEYFCDVCSISVRYPMVCPCCQGPMMLRMKPESP
jgi:hypothetical protein